MEPSTTTPSSSPTLFNQTKVPHKPPSRAPTVVPTPTAMKVSSANAATQAGGSYVTAVFVGSIGGVVFIVIAIVFLIRFCDSSSAKTTAAAAAAAVMTTTSNANTSSAIDSENRQDKKVFVDHEDGDFEMRSTRVEDLYVKKPVTIMERNPSVRLLGGINN